VSACGRAHLVILIPLYSRSMLHYHKTVLQSYLNKSFKNLQNVSTRKLESSFLSFCFFMVKMFLLSSEFICLLYFNKKSYFCFLRKPAYLSDLCMLFLPNNRIYFISVAITQQLHLSFYYDFIRVIFFSIFYITKPRTKYTTFKCVSSNRWFDIQQ